MKRKYRFALDDSIVTNIVKSSVFLLTLLILILLDVTGKIDILAENPKWLYIITGACILWLLRLNAGIIRYIEIEPNKITIVKVIGKVVLEDYVTIEPINLYLLDNDTTYIYHDSDSIDSTLHGLTMKETSFTSSKYGSFTRISNNLNELAMVRCNGKNYLINYPKELFEETKDGKPTLDNAIHRE